MKSPFHFQIVQSSDITFVYSLQFHERHKRVKKVSMIHRSTLQSVVVRVVYLRISYNPQTSHGQPVIRVLLLSSATQEDK